MANETALRTDLLLALDPVAFAARYAHEPDDWQAKILRGDATRSIVVASRQSGKSETAAVLTEHQSIYRSGSLTLLVSPSLRQSQELFRKVVEIHRQIENVPTEAETKLTLEFENGSRVVSLPGKEKTIRAYSAVDLLILDEAARAPDDLYTAVRPMLAVSGGRLILLSSARFRQGFFYRTWADGDPDIWSKMLITAEDCPRISAEFLAQEREEMSDWEYAAEYEGVFASPSDLGVFSYSEIEAAIEAGKEIELWDMGTLQS